MTSVKSLRHLVKLCLTHVICSTFAVERASFAQSSRSRQLVILFRPICCEKLEEQKLEIRYSVHLSPSRAHRNRLRRRPRARRTKIREGRLKRKRERFARRTRVASLNSSYTPAKTSKSRDSSRRRFSAASRLIDAVEHSFFRSRARVFAENVPVRESTFFCNGGQLTCREVTTSQLRPFRFEDGDNKSADLFR